MTKRKALKRRKVETPASDEEAAPRSDLEESWLKTRLGVELPEDDLTKFVAALADHRDITDDEIFEARTELPSYSDICWKVWPPQSNDTLAIQANNYTCVLPRAISA